MRAGLVGGGATQSEQYYKNMLDGVYKIARDEGVLALYRGSLARILYHMPNVAICMTCVETLKPHIQRAIEGSEVSESNLVKE
jgi:Mitochondrial carrier protein